MANNIIRRTWKQGGMVNIEDLRGSAFQAEDGGHTFLISGVDENGDALALSGTPAGVLLRADGQDVTLTCSVSNGVVSATLPANAYVVPGRIGITIFLTNGGQKTAIYAAIAAVATTSSGTVAPPTGADVVTLVNAIETAISQIPASDTNLKGALAPTYSTSAVYAVGSYAWYDGKLYKCTTAITSGETWTSAHWTEAKLANDVTDLKSALNSYTPLGTTNLDTNNLTLYNGRIKAATGATDGGSADANYKHVELAVKYGETITFTCSGASAGSGYGYSFLNSNNEVVGYNSDYSLRNVLTTVAVPETAVLFKVGWDNASAIIAPYKDIVIKDYGETYIGLDRRLTKTEEDVAEHYDLLENAYMDALGVNDNLLTDVWEFGTKHVDIISEITLYQNGIQKEMSGQDVYGIKGAMASDLGHAILRVKKTGVSGRTFLFMHASSGFSVAFPETLDAGTNLYQANKPATYPTPMGKVLESDEDYITVLLYNVTKENQTTHEMYQDAMTFRSYSSYTDYNTNTPSKLELDINHSAMFNSSVALSEIQLGRRYYSRSEKLHSLLRGKTAIVFSDSLAGIINYIVKDWGMTCITIARGGARMGYENGSGAGGESGTANQLWLCNNDRITLFKTYQPEICDYIINLSGSNGTLPEFDSTELKYVLANKRWFDSESDTDPWTSLSDENKARFTSSACYIAAFISLMRIYKNARPIMGGIYVLPTAATGESSGGWDTYDHAVDAIYSVASSGKLAKNDILKQMAELMGVPFIDAGLLSEVSALNSPYYAPGGVHPIPTIQAVYAAQLCRVIGAPDL